MVHSAGLEAMIEKENDHNKLEEMHNQFEINQIDQNNIPHEEKKNLDDSGNIKDEKDKNKENLSENIIYPGEKQDHLLNKQENLGVEQNNLGEEQNNLGEEQENLGELKENLGDQQNNLGEEQENFGVEQENLSEKQENFGEKQENLEEDIIDKSINNGRNEVENDFDDKVEGE